MLKLALCLLLLGLSSALYQEPNPADLKLAIAAKTVDVLKLNVIMPLVEQKAPGMTINQTIEVEKLGVTIEISNVMISNLTLDWANTHLLALDEYGQPSVSIRNLTVGAVFDAGLKFLGLNYKGSDNSIEIIGFDLDLGFGFGKFDNGTIYAFVNSTNIKQQDIKIQLSRGLAEAVVKLGKLLGIKLSTIGSIIMEKAILDLNSTIIAKSAQGLSLALLDLVFNVSISELPYVFQAQDDTYISLALDFIIQNTKTNELSPVRSFDSIPNYIDGELPIQAILSESFIAKALWAAFQSGKIDKALAQPDLPSSAPITLNTTDLTVLFPNIIKDFGQDKGVYIHVQASGGYPLEFISDGRLTLVLPLQVDFVVDTDSSQYPQNFTSCTTCQTAVSLNISAFVSLTLFRGDATHLGVRIIDVELAEVTLLSGDVDAEDFRNTLNNLLAGIIVQLNVQLSEMQNPLYGLKGLNDMSLAIGDNYLFAGVSFDETYGLGLLNH